MRVPHSFAALLAWATLNACEQSALEADGGHRADGGRQADAFQPRPDGPEAPSCAEMASPPLLECFRGTVFADCGGGIQSSLHCRPEGVELDAPRCMWFVGCPAQEYSEPGVCPSEAQCIHANAGWGRDPWDRQTAMDLTVTVDPAINGGEPPLSLSCECLGGECPATTFLCDPTSERVRTTYPDGNAAWGLPSLVSIIHKATPPGEEFFGEDWLVLELDFFSEPRTARGCIIVVSDSSVASQPICANSGSITIDHEPDGVEDVGGLSGGFEIWFGATSGQGLAVRGTF